VFAAEGCRLMLSARSAGPLAEAALRASTANVAAHAADVSKPDDRLRAASV
jgi:NADP-dependent 3-hydroxy acid dehydrogenase YdfG